MHLSAPGYVLIILPLLLAGVWRLSLSDGDENPIQSTLAVVGTLAVLWIVVSAIASYG
jgi:hypothetical protein